jgi:hypothetical protein
MTDMTTQLVTWKAPPREVSMMALVTRIGSMPGDQISDTLRHYYHPSLVQVAQFALDPSIEFVVKPRRYSPSRDADAEGRLYSEARRLRYFVEAANIANPLLDNLPKMQKLIDDLACSLAPDECQLLVNICNKKLVPGIEPRHVFEAWPQLAPWDLQDEYQRRGIQRELQQTNPNANATADAEAELAQAQQRFNSLQTEELLTQRRLRFELLASERKVQSAREELETFKHRLGSGKPPGLFRP